MIMQLFKKKKELGFERTYASPVEIVWRALTEADMLREWWGPKYEGTRWPMEGTFSVDEDKLGDPLTRRSTGGQ